MLKDEIAFLRRRLAAIEPQWVAVNKERDALLQSIKLLESAANGSATKTPTNEFAVGSFVANGLRDAVRALLSHGREMPEEVLEEALAREYAPFRAMSPRALETCLYKLSVRKEIQIRTEGNKRFVTLINKEPQQ